MKAQIDPIIPCTIIAVDKHLVEEGQISSQYNGYVASFGASIVQSGLLAALLFNHRSTNRSERDRRKLMETLYDIVKEIRNDQMSNHPSLFDYGKSIAEKDISQFKNQILNAATAIKLVIRTYPLTKENNPE